MVPMVKNGVQSSGNPGSVQPMQGPPDPMHQFTPEFQERRGQSAMVTGPWQPSSSRQPGSPGRWAMMPSSM